MTARANVDHLLVEFKNISPGPVSFHLDTCGICFWSVSENGGPWEMLNKAMHSRPCNHKDLVTLAPGETVTRDPEKSSPGPMVQTRRLGTIKLRYRSGSYENPYGVLESNEVSFK